MNLSLPLVLVVLASDAGATDPFERGKAALAAKDTATAIEALTACVKATPNRVECRWELGWAHYLKADWALVVEQWEAVERLAPKHPELAENLTSARERFEAERRVAMAAAAGSKPRPPPPPGAVLRLRAAGDVMLGTDAPEGFLPPEDGAKLLTAVKPLLEDADLTFINLEGPLCDGGSSNKCPRPSSTCYAFRSPTRYGQYLKDVGVDLASTANNHSGDYGEECRRQTEATLDALGIPWSGPPGSIAYTEKNGLKVALVAFHTSPACNDVNNHRAAANLVKAAANNANLVIVSFHGGAEGAKAIHVPRGRETFHRENRGDLRKFTDVVVDAGADLVLGHGPHVLRGMELKKGRLVAYSLGNFATYGRFNLSGRLGVGMVLEVNLAADGAFKSGRILPTEQIGEGVPRPDPTGRAIQQVRELTREDFGGGGLLIDEDGNLSAAGDGVEAARAAP